MKRAAHGGAGRGGWLALGLLLVSLLLVLLGTGVGSTGLENLWPALWGHDAEPSVRAMAQQIVWEIRLPRTLGAWMAGALLGLAGAVAQGLFRNPLADPYLLGSASGASLGVALALALVGGVAGLAGGAPVSVFSSHWLVRLGLTGAAFVGAVLAVLLTLALARGVQHTLRLLLAGVIVGVVLGAFTSLILLLSPDSLQAMQAFLLGSTGFVGWSACALMAAVWALCQMAAWALARALDGLALGEATALSLGLPLAPLRAA
ncbi:ABC transporter permease, partial [Rhodococcus sp. SRB_17]|nr:ABC transporter permease [Rhodococcus sp. SRB_17]